MEAIKKIVKKDVFGIINDYCMTVLIYRKKGPEGKLVALDRKTNSKHLRIYLDLIDSMCTVRSQKRGSGNWEINNYVIPVNFLCKNKYFTQKDGLGLYNKGAKYKLCTAFVWAPNNCRAQIYHSDVIDYFQQYIEVEKKYVIKYVPNSKRILRLISRTGYEYVIKYDKHFHIISDYDSRIEIFPGYSGDTYNYDPDDVDYDDEDSNTRIVWYEKEALLVPAIKQ